ncbi:hypothetical protein [Bacillus haynesii]|uniref:hypothetical protein n=1 Tax=Bacillus haynesii TaxID=1925021 RepID=UPI00227FA5AB|nr:hypothetical protein [Bacillus haynesii]MCY9274558.1 hypothetical protein [Bacillus haynesii]
MARLYGVKTLDMVNGEITKVAYERAEYERVVGDAQDGDLVLITDDSWCDATKGEFYLCVGISATDPRIVDDIDEDDSNYVESYVLFRKVSASQPSLEDRVSTNEKDIESLKSDVAALKGEAKPEYVRIDKGEAKVGDFVKYVVTASPSVKIGRLYEIIGLRSGRHFAHIDEDGDRVRTVPNGVFEVYRKVSAAKPKPERLKVGDYAKVVAKISGHLACEGDVVVIKEDYKDYQPFLCEDLNGCRLGYFYERELVRATDEEVAEAKDATARAKFKKGAKVRLKSGGGENPLYGFENGKVYTVVDNDYPHRRTEKKIQIEADWYYGFATPDQLELLSEEDAAEIEKWAAIGREVGAYKAGDIIAYGDRTAFENNGFGEVVSESDGGTLRIEAVDNYGDVERYNVGPDELKLIVPVEARFDRR